MPLSGLVLPPGDGLELITLIRYPFPAMVLTGIILEIVPAEEAVEVPIVVALAKLPKESESCAEKILFDGVFGKAQELSKV